MTTRHEDAAAGRAADAADAVPADHAGAALPLAGLVLAAAGPIALSGKALIVKPACRHDGVDAVNLIMLRMMLALPRFVALSRWAGRGRAPPTARNGSMVAASGPSGYRPARFVDFARLARIPAGLERLIPYMTPTTLLALGVALVRTGIWRLARAGR